MNRPQDRGKNYIGDLTGTQRAEVAVNWPEGLDFQGEQRVNPEDLNGGNPMEPATAPAPTNSLDGLEYLFKSTPGTAPVEQELAEAVE